MEKLKVGRKPLPELEKKVAMVAYVKKEHKYLIISKYGSLTEAILHEILPKLNANGHSNSTWNWESVAR